MYGCHRSVSVNVLGLTKSEPQVRCHHHEGGVGSKRERVRYGLERESEKEGAKKKKKKEIKM